jgi:hypothetical protein
MTVADLAFEYGRAVCALADVADETKTRALTLVTHAIIPLVGNVPVAVLTPALCDSVGQILADEDGDDGRRVAYVWRDLVRWSEWFLWSRSGDLTL